MREKEEDKGKEKERKQDKRMKELYDLNIASRKYIHYANGEEGIRGRGRGRGRREQRETSTKIKWRRKDDMKK